MSSDEPLRAAPSGGRRMVRIAGPWAAIAALLVYVGIQGMHVAAAAALAAGVCVATWLGMRRVRRAEAAVVAASRRYRLLFERNVAGVFRAGLDGRILECNEAFARMLGHDRPEDVVGTERSLLDADPAPHEELVRRLREQGSLTNRELPLRRRDGTLLWALMNVSVIRQPDTGATVMAGTVTDITERRRAEEAVRESEARLRRIVDSALEAIVTMDAGGRITGWSPRAVEIFGWSREEILGRWLVETIIPPADREAHARGLRRFLESGEGPILNRRIRVTGQRRDGSAIPVELTVTAAESDDGWSFTGFLRDLTAEEKATEALRASEERLSRILETVADGIMLVDGGGRITFANAAAERILGLSRAELTRMRYDAAEWEVTRPDGGAMAPEERPISIVLRRGEPLYGAEIGLRRRDGVRTIVAVNGAPLRDSSGAVVGMVASLRDVTRQREAERDRRSLEEQLWQSQRMEAVGRLAGGIAHDFNNLLTAIKGHALLLLEEKRGGDAIAEELEDIRQAADRAADLIRQLLAFSRRQVLQPVVLDLDEVVHDMDRMLRRVIGEDVDFVTRAAPGLGRVRADRAQIEQVLMNLVINARDAMPQGGRLVMEMGNADAGGEQGRAHADLAPGAYVRLSVRDTGHGMSEEVRSRIFEPFFTTKEMGKGTGLGLSTVYGIVQQSGGRIYVASEEGRGSTFDLYLPRVEGETAEPSAAARIRPAAGGDETILLVEDEPLVRELALRILARRGYRVLVAGGPREAIRVAGEHSGPIDLLLTDVVMPQMNGPRLAAALRASRPELRVLMMSGYSDLAARADSGLGADVDLIGKPFTPEELIGRVRAAIDRGAAG